MRVEVLEDGYLLRFHFDQKVKKAVDKLERTVFQMSRAAEYFNVSELVAQTGQPEKNFTTVALKELMDNGLDAAETAGVAPEIEIHVEETEDLLTFSVWDNGKGITSDTMKKILDFDTRTSDKFVYVSPTRGAQGNALKTVLGMPYALGVDRPVVVESQGLEHVMRLRTDPSGELRTVYEELMAEGDRPGTRVSLTFPRDGQVCDFSYWARAFALFNPHATVKIYLAKLGGVKISESYHPTVKFPGEWRKYLPTDQTSPWWYDREALGRLVFSHITLAKKEEGHNVTLRDFVRQFWGLSGTAKAKRVCDQFPEVKHLTDFEKAEERVAELLAAMQGQTKAPSAQVLGLVGEEHFRKCFELWYGSTEVGYYKAAGIHENRPWSCEVALAEEVSKGYEEEPDETLFYHGINFSPTYEDPMATVLFSSHDRSVRGLGDFLSQARVMGKPVVVHSLFPF